ncbi:hypothetical protein A0H81_10292 [Grifola frondosa]|uniref:Uncharacterized protein n=1 Tax=Grifola frondosa TaxID=5627 RepID=A0A1C7LZC4_GRIFR|nr:hypothetical protein A0H81_10292 [Grifola frondosa]
MPRTRRTKKTHVAGSNKDSAVKTRRLRPSTPQPRTKRTSNLARQAADPLHLDEVLGYRGRVSAAHAPWLRILAGPGVCTVKNRVSDRVVPKYHDLLMSHSTTSTVAVEDLSKISGNEVEPPARSATVDYILDFDIRGMIVSRLQ